jgi:homoserine dehydrogenase
MRQTPKGCRVSVAPTLVPLRHMLSSVEDVFNAIIVNGNAVGDVFFYGQGAGKRPTASAVVSDIIEAALGEEIPEKPLWDSQPQPLLGDEDMSSAFYIRTRGLTQEEMASLPSEVSFLTASGAAEGERAFITPEMTFGRKDALFAPFKDKILLSLPVLSR